MGGMRLQPKDVHREVVQRSERQFGNDPVLYAIWLGEPQAEGSELLGRTERLSRPRWWRAFPVTGEFPQECRSHTVAVQHLIDIRQGHLLVEGDKTLFQQFAEEARNYQPESAYEE